MDERLRARVAEPSVTTTEGASFADQYRAAMESAVVTMRPERVGIRVTGTDGESFLHNMLSAHIHALADGQGAPALFLTNKGKLIAALSVHKETAGQLRLTTDVESAERLVQALSRYIIAEDVTLTSLADEQSILSVEGPDASRHLHDRLGVATDALGGLSHLSSVDAPDVRLRVTALRHEPSARYDVHGPAGEVATLRERLIEAGVTEGSERLAEARRIETGRPRFGVDIDETLLPQEAGLENHVHFEKGCYIGQEYVVRLAHRGHVNRSLTGLRIEHASELAPGTGVRHDGKPVGTLTSVQFSPGLDASVALAMLARDAREPGVRVQLDTPDPVTAVVTELPFRSKSS